MRVTREQAVAALFARLTGSGYFVSAGRRNRAPESFAPETTPALMLVNDHHGYDRVSPSAPAKRTIYLRAILYFDAGPDLTAVPDTAVNEGLDVIELALAPDDPISGRCTLGGLVYSAMLKDDADCAPGDITGKSIALPLIEIILP